MADKKISALTAATTPLDGTEVLPIVQSGATVKATNNDLRPKQIQSNATSGVLQIVGPAAAATRVMTVPDANFTAARTDAAQSFTGNQTLSTGNLVQGTAGKGFSFAANTTAAGATSSLLNWYEEGYFNPTLTCGTSGTITLDSAEDTLAYTRIGRVVYISGQFAIASVSSPVGTVVLNNLPFAVASLSERAESALFNVLLSNTTTNTPTFFGRINTAGGTTLAIIAKDNTGALNTSPANLFAASDVWISGFYLAA